MIKINANITFLGLTKYCLFKRKLPYFFNLLSMKGIITHSMFSLFLLFSCSDSEVEKPIGDDDNGQIINKPFTEGSVEMGIFSNDIDLGGIINKIDFSENDVKRQYENLIEKDEEVKNIVDVIRRAGNQNPLVALAMTMNISECTYYLKNNEVLADVRGFGWNMHNYHNTSLDKGSIYLETLTKFDEIAKEDRVVYTSYRPSQNTGITAINTIDFSGFEREVQSEKRNILGYECSAIEYVPKFVDENTPLQLQKIIVYTSPLFSNTINFTHPFYLAENDGILRLDIYYLKNESPTLIMKPKNIKEHAISPKNLTSKIGAPVYSIDDMNWGFKSLAIMMSGWGMLEK
ncbi:hypothetical protein ORI89_04955 [Sphingobacterium sp. UT-1RO-CII-1]|uniref:hypothetical protein n=1 Tax=Sphingobacterium sp. UT-1RO-CII-1 TaxID=2995225 RepID=UPI00227C01E0|nr:hypothetical protein [Sphingobacterium sp. UT-1RO-CII-1]MCY4778987.1 hypothetical protein [Sphingobacterium sp. UT-1RO-CII-1]